MIGNGAFASCHQGRKTLLAMTLPKGPIPTGEHVAPVHRFIIFSRVSNRERFQIGAVREENAGILRSEGMESLRRDGEAEKLKAVFRHGKRLYRQNEMIDTISVRHFRAPVLRVCA